MKEHLSNEHISQIIQTPYETRSHTDHRILIHIIANSIPHCSAETAKKLSFFIDILPPDQQPPLQSMLLLRQDKNSDIFQQIIYHHQPTLSSALASSTLSLIITNKDQCKSQHLASSIEQEIKCLQNSDYLSQVPKKRFYSVIKQAQIMLLCYGEHVYSEGSEQSNDIFFVRKGDFCYEVKNENQEKNIEIFQFKEGHLFSQLPFDYKEQQQQENSQVFHLTRPKINLSVRCKSSKGVLYRFSRDFFSSHLFRYCQSALKVNTDRLITLLTQRVDCVQQHRKSNCKLLAQKIPRSLSMQLQALRDQKAGTSRKGSMPKEPEPVLDISEKSHDYRTLKNEQPIRNKLYTKGELAKLSVNPEKNESDLLLWKKSKCLKLRELSKPIHPPLSKAETMLEFIKSTVLFQKNRRKPSVL